MPIWFLKQSFEGFVPSSKFVTNLFASGGSLLLAFSLFLFLGLFFSSDFS